MSDLIAPGDVWLVGAGPGDPDLLTRKAEALIRAASVIFHDALIGPGILDLVPRSVRLVAVGKRSGRHSSTQAEIDALLVAAALAGERVVRLKGGDPSIFGRSMEEIDALAQVGVRVRICPGITAASAAAASAGISLSLRGVARQVRFVTAQTWADGSDALDWAALADPGATLAFYMGRAAAAEIRRNLIAHGLAPDTPVLIASNVSLPDERLVQTRLDLLPVVIDAAAGSAPSLILIGEAVRARAAVPCSYELERLSHGGSGIRNFLCGLSAARCTGSHSASESVNSTMYRQTRLLVAKAAVRGGRSERQQSPTFCHSASPGGDTKHVISTPRYPRQAARKARAGDRGRSRRRRGGV